MEIYKMIKQKSIILLTVILFLSAFSIQAKTIKDKYGKEFISKKSEVSYAIFKRIKQDRIPIYSERKVASDLVKYLGALEFVELVDGKMGVTFAKIRAYHKVKGYVEGYTKVSFFFKQSYFSEPFEMSVVEIKRLKDLENKKIELKAKREKRKEQRRKEQIFNDVILGARESILQVLDMNYSEVVNYLKPTTYKLDNMYNTNASKTIKFESPESSIYFTFVDKKILGFKVISNTEGFTEKEANIILYETVGEIYYSIEKIDEINEHIIKKNGIMEKTKLAIVVKADKSKLNPVLELILGEFSGIE